MSCLFTFRDGLEEAALRQKKEQQARHTQDTDQVLVRSSPAAGSQHCSQPPTPSAFSLVQHPQPRAPSLGGSPSCAAPGEQTPTQYRASGSPAMQSADVPWKGPAVAQQGQLLDSQRSWKSAPHMLAHSSATAVHQSQIRHPPACPSIDRTGCPPQSHDKSNPLPALGASSSQHSPWGSADNGLAERRLSGASAGCSGRGPQRISSPLRPLTNGSRPPRESSLSSPVRSHQPQQAWAGDFIHASVSATTQLQRPNEPSAAEINHEGIARREGLGQQLAAQRSCEGGGRDSRRNSFGVRPGDSVGVGLGGPPCARLANVHRQVSHFRELLPGLPLLPSSYAKCAPVAR